VVEATYELSLLTVKAKEARRLKTTVRLYLLNAANIVLDARITESYKNIHSPIRH
jgi:hypothetical protein